jgi:3-methyladenine DNA glycosylase AlkC
MAHRKGARSRDSINPEILLALNSGVEESANLVEWLATDKVSLLRVTAARHPDYSKALYGAANVWEESQSGIIGCYKSVGSYLALFPEFTIGGGGFEMLSGHRSDSIRGLACFIAYFSLSNSSEFKSASAVAARNRAYTRVCSELITDSHFGVRELVWLAMRAGFIENGPSAFEHLSELAVSEHAYMRRFASEVSRPVGVWAAHVNWLKSNPEYAESFLNLLRADSSRYVQDSVGNWLNDAAKTRPDWVWALTDSWLSGSDSEATRYIVKRGLRSIRK